MTEHSSTAQAEAADRNRQGDDPQADDSAARRESLTRPCRAWQRDIGVQHKEETAGWSREGRRERGGNQSTDRTQRAQFLNHYAG